MLTTNLSQYSNNQEIIDDDISLESFELPEQKNTPLVNSHTVRTIEMLDIMDEYHPDRLTLENQIELNQRLYSAGMGNAQRITKYNFDNFQEQLTMGLMDTLKKWRDDFKDRAKDKKVQSAQGLDFLKKLKERLTEMEGYEASAGEIDIRADKVSEITLTGGKGLADFKPILSNMKLYVANCDTSEKDIFELVKKAVKDGDTHFNFIPEAKKFYNLTINGEEVKGGETQYVLGNYQDSINEIIATEPNIINLASAIKTKDAKQQKKDITLPVMSLSEMASLTDELIKHIEQFYKVYDVTKINKQMKTNIAEIQTIADNDIRRARIIMKTMAANHSFSLFADDEQFDGAVSSMIRYMRDCFKVYKKKS